jgi:photosystem II stability/assembly factor-like uncharacterized protein
MQHIFTRSTFLALAFIAISVCLSGQSTRDLFSRPGLSIGAYHWNFFDGTWNTAYRFAGDTVLCGDTLLRFEPLTYTPNKVLLKIQDGKVFLQNPDNPCVSANLYYDFDLQLGQNFQVQAGGPVLQVTETGQKTLLNGEIRRYLRLTGTGGWNIEWIEGIGDVNHGLFPAFYDFEGSDQFVCARDASGELWQVPAEYWKCDSLLCPVPIPQFTANTDELTASFSNTSLNGLSWLWEFGDGQTSTEKNPQHTYAGPGCYEVCLTAYTDCLERGFRFCAPTPLCVAPSWEPFTPIPTIGSEGIVELEFLTPELGWLLTGLSIWKTIDGGQNWVKQPYPLAPSPTTRILRSIHMLDAQNGIIGCGHYSGNGSEKAILVTQDGGETWEERAPGSYFLSDAILSNDGQGFAVGQFRDLIYSADGGETWATRDIPGTVDLVWLQYMGGDTLYGFGLQGLAPQHTPIFAKTFDSGLTWHKTLMPDWPVQYDAHFLNTQDGWALGKAGQLIHTLDAGQTWQPYFFGESLEARSIDFANEHSGWVVGEKGLVLHTTHGGFDWQRENCGYLGDMYDLNAPSPDFALSSAHINQFEVRKYAPGPFPNCGLSVWDKEAAQNQPMLLLKPNPSSDFLNVEITGGTPLKTGDKILIVNSLGQISLVQDCTNGALEINVSQLPKGCYALVVLREKMPIASGRFVKL